MKFIRFLLACLLLAIALAAVFAACAFTSGVQTRIAQIALARQPGLRGSLGSLSAGFGKVDVEDLRLEIDGAVLALPSLQARLPLTTAVWDRKILVRNLVAKGWILDLSGTSEPKDAQAQALSASTGKGGAGTPAPGKPVSMQKVAHAFGGIFGGWRLPCDVSLDGADLEGDVLLAAPPGQPPVQVHVIVKGGGMAAGHEGAFVIDVSTSDSGLPASAVAAHGRLVAVMDSPRTLGRIEIKADLSGEYGSPPQDLALTADVTAARSAGGETYTLNLSHGPRHFATVAALFPEATRRFAGTWKVDLRDSDLAPFIPVHPLPSVVATGEGRFEADSALTRIHALGRLNAVESHWGVLAPPLDRLGAVTIGARFDMVRSGQSIRVDRLSVSFDGARPVAVMQSLQPFEVDERTGELKMTDPHGDWMKASIRGLPLAWLSDPAGRFTLAGGDATGEFVIRAANEGFILRPKGPLTAAGVSLRSAGRVLGRGLDLSLSLLADRTPQGWRVQGAPFTVGNAGRRLAAFSATASRLAGADQAIVIAGKWNADLDALASGPALPEIRWITGRSASGRFSASVGAETEVEGKLAVIGHAPGDTLTASVHADVDADGTVALIAPLKIAFGSSVSEVSADATWTPDEAGSRIDLKLTGGNVALEHLRLLAASLAAAGGAPWAAHSAAEAGGPGAPAGARARIPFWGDWVGSLTLAFDRLRAGNHEFTDVGGTFDVGRRSIRLEGGRARLPQHGLATAEGSISFDAAAPFPYTLKAAATAREIDTAPLFAALQTGKEPVIEGRFSIASTLTGNGINLEDLAGRTQEEFRLTSTEGIIRLLKTSVADSIPQASTPIRDTLGTVGSALGPIFGFNKDSADSGRNPVSKTAEAVLDFTSRVSEIGYDQITVTAIRGPDRTIRLVEIAMTAPDERLTGSGRITYAKGQPFAEQPLSMELQFGGRGAIAELLSKAGLLSSHNHKDNLGYTMLEPPIHFGGTLEQIDERQWRDLLAKAALRSQPEKAGR